MSAPLVTRQALMQALRRLRISDCDSLGLQAAGAATSVAQLRNAAQPFRLHCGIYFLFQGDALVYIGQSSNAAQRLATHSITGAQVPALAFDRVAFVRCHPSQLDWLESVYIHAFRPPRNGPPPIRDVEALIARAPECHPDSTLTVSQMLALFDMLLGTRAMKRIAPALSAEAIQ